MNSNIIKISGELNSIDDGANNIVVDSLYVRAYTDGNTEVKLNEFITSVRNNAAGTGSLPENAAQRLSNIENAVNNIVDSLGLADDEEYTEVLPIETNPSTFVLATNPVTTALLSGLTYYKYEVSANTEYILNVTYGSTAPYYKVILTLADNTLESNADKLWFGEDTPDINLHITTRSNTKYLYVNAQTGNTPTLYKLSQQDSLEELTASLGEPNLYFSISRAPAISYGTFDGVLIYKYSVLQGETYIINFVFELGFLVNKAIWIDSNGNIIKNPATNDYQYEGLSTNDYIASNKEVTAPNGAVLLWINVQTKKQNTVSVYHKIEGSSTSNNIINVKELKERIDAIESFGGSNKLMKVVVSGINGSNPSFYIRTKYNEQNDIIVTQGANYNNCLTFKSAYIGPNDKSDELLLTSDYLVSNHQDSTGPLLNATQYDHLFLLHGCPIPTINYDSYFDNKVGLTFSGVISKTIDGQIVTTTTLFTIGCIDTNRIYLIPVFTEDNGHYIRGWLSFNSGSVTLLDGKTVTQNGYIQLRPIMKIENRNWFVDGNPITEDGTYKCDEFSVNESLIGYDPRTITNWFSGNTIAPNLDNAAPLVNFTYSFNYKGAQCAVNTTIEILGEIEFSRYGATLQLFFSGDEDYKPYFIIPKTQNYNNLTDFESVTNISIQKRSEDLIDVGNLPERVIGCLKTESNLYKVGMAAGYSLVHGNTVNQSRLELIQNGGPVITYSGGKFYPTAFTGTAVNGSNYFLSGFFKEINYYVSYFDPAENVGQVYWYKDGSEYIIYAHCQEEKNNLVINVPGFMEGLHLSVIEKTNGASLLTDTIHNGKFFVNYNNGSNYIVLRTGCA